MTSAAGDLPTLLSHRRLIDQLLLASVPDATSFSDLMSVMDGAGPADVIDGLRRHAGSHDMAFQIESLLADALLTGTTPLASRQPETLPLPHPLDSEWRFASDTVDELLGRLIEATRPGDELLLVGTPTLAATLGRTAVDRRIRFVGPDDVVSAAVHDIFAGDPRFVTGQGAAAAAAIVDPPWYADHFTDMLSICARGCRPGAPILTVVPRTATRPGVDADIDSMLAGAMHLRLQRSDTSAMEVRYRTPLFEARSLESAGIRADLGDWRRGDCLTLWRLDGRVPLRPARAGHPSVELTLDGCRVRLLPGVAPTASGIRAAERDEVSASVSARSPTRGKANLWTSSNRAFVVDESASLEAMITIAEQEGIVLPSRLASGPGCPKRKNAVETGVNMIHYIRELFKRERLDAARLAGEGSWLNTARDLRCSGEWSSMSRPALSGTTASAISSSRARGG